MAQTVDDVRALVARIASRLDPSSRYVPELLALFDGADDLAVVEARLLAGCRGQRHAEDAYSRMTLEEKVLANLITPETKWERFEDAEVAMLSSVSGRILVVPCSRGEEVYTIAAYAPTAEVIGVDVQPALVRLAEARSDHPPEIRAALDARTAPIRFTVGDAFDLPEELGHFDLISCRNFLGYFVDSIATECARALFRRADRLLLDPFCLSKFGGLGPSLVVDGGLIERAIPAVRRV